MVTREAMTFVSGGKDSLSSATRATTSACASGMFVPSAKKRDTWAAPRMVRLRTCWTPGNRREAFFERTGDSRQQGGRGRTRQRRDHLLAKELDLRIDRLRQAPRHEHACSRGDDHEEQDRPALTEREPGGGHRAPPSPPAGAGAIG